MIQAGNFSLMSSSSITKGHPELSKQATNQKIILVGWKWEQYLGIMFWCSKGQLFSRDRRLYHWQEASPGLHSISFSSYAESKWLSMCQRVRRKVRLTQADCNGTLYLLRKRYSHHKQKSHIMGCKWNGKEQNSTTNVLENNWTNFNPISQSEKRLLRSFLHRNPCSPVHIWENGDVSLSIWWYIKWFWVAKKETDLHIILIFLLLPLP